MNKNQNHDSKKDIRETIKILAWAAICAGLVFSLNSKCTGPAQSDTNAMRDANRTRTTAMYNAAHASHNR